MSHEFAKRLEVLRVFLRLGCTSFGGPIAHLGSFRVDWENAAPDLLVAAAAFAVLTVGGVRSWTVVLAAVAASILMLR